MPYQPSANDVYVSRTLGNFAQAQAQKLENFVAMRTFPKVEVGQETGKYFEFPRGSWNRSFAQVRGPNEEVKTGGFPVTTKDYSCKLWAVGSDVDQNTQNNQDPVVKIKQRKTRWVTQQMYLACEAEFGTNYFTTGKWGVDVTGTTGSPTLGTSFRQWDHGSATTIADVQYGRTRIVRSTGGYDPNTLLLGFTTYQGLKTAVDLVDRLKFTSSEALQRAIMARLFEVEQILVASSVVNSSEEGQADSNAFQLGDSALLCYVTPNPGISDTDLTAGAFFFWTGMEGSINGLQVADIPIPLKRSSRIEMQAAWDHKLVSADAGFFFSDCTAATA